jgi:hypothetical protein
MLGRWREKEDQSKLDLIYTWANNTAGEVMATWMNDASASVGLLGWKKRAKRARLAGAKVYKHFR